jgi:putative transposase
MLTSGIFNKLTGYHNRHSIRLCGYDYSQPGYYFITVCIHDHKQQLFGDIFDSKMIETENAGIVRACWNNLPNHYANVKLDEFVIMPNHIHGIIIIRNSAGAGPSRPDAGPSHSIVEFQHDNNQNGNGEPGRDDRDTGRDDRDSGRDDRAPTVGKIVTLGKIVAYFKYQSTKQINDARKSDMRKIWQRNYYDQIIRDEKQLYFIRKYIKENPLRWLEDSESHVTREINEYEIIGK